MRRKNHYTSHKRQESLNIRIRYIEYEKARKEKEKKKRAEQRFWEIINAALEKEGANKDEDTN